MRKGLNFAPEKIKKIRPAMPLKEAELLSL
jgi:hypothetical protein